MTQIIKVDEIPQIVTLIKQNHAKMVLIGGVFDGIHPGHIEFIKKAKRTGDVLVLLLEHDSSVKQKKGPGKPRFSQNSRAQNLSTVEGIDYVVLLPPNTSNEFYFELVKKTKPDIIAITKGDSELKNKKAQAKMVGGRIKEVMVRNTKYSSTNLVKK